VLSGGDHPTFGYSFPADTRMTIMNMLRRWAGLVPATAKFAQRAIAASVGARQAQHVVG
jgi:hypothetical protein